MSGLVGVRSLSRLAFRFRFKSSFFFFCLNFTVCFSTCYFCEGKLFSFKQSKDYMIFFLLRQFKSLISLLLLWFIFCACNSCESKLSFTYSKDHTINTFSEYESLPCLGLFLQGFLRIEAFLLSAAKVTLPILVGMLEAAMSSLAGSLLRFNLG